MAYNDFLEKINNLENKVDTLLNIFQSYIIQKPISDCSYTLFAWLDEWYKVYKVPALRPNSLEIIEVAIRVHIKKGLPDILLNHLTGLQLQKFFTDIERSRTRKIVFDVLNGALKTACSIKLIKDNPMQGVTIPVHKRVKGSALDNKEQVQFLSAIKGHRLENYFKFLLFTGCRRGEGLALKSSNIDFKKKLLHVAGTKTENANRTIPLFENVAALLAPLKPQKEGFYFPFRPDYPTHAFKKICPTHKLHDLRHTFATNCLAAKIPLKIVQIWLGHSEIDTTANIYTHVTQEINTVEANNLNAYLKQKNAL